MSGPEIPVDCKHELPLTQCSLCKPAKDYPVWDALYEGVCITCLHVIDVGQRVTWNREGTRVVHAAHGRQ